MHFCSGNNSVSPIESSENGIKDCGLTLSELDEERSSSKTAISCNGGVITPIGGEYNTPSLPHSHTRWISTIRKFLNDQLCSGSLRLKFNDQTLEKYYQLYASKQKVVHFMSLLIFNIGLALILAALSIYQYEDKKIPLLVVVSTSLMVSISSFVVYKSDHITGTSLVALSYLLWIFLLVQLFVNYITNSNGSNSDVIGNTKSWILLLCFFTYVVLPARRLYCCLLSIFVNISHLTMELVQCLTSELCDRSYSFKDQVIGNVYFYVAINAIGYLTAYLTEKNQRTAFLEIKESIISNSYIEEQLRDQMDLLLSVLPQHVAMSMMADSVFKGEPRDDQFRKMYMIRHDNVSILFADIVGFTTLSSERDATEVCSLLNELFTAFDDLAEKYHQLRIKILGDCYYCISGAPEPRSDHAVLCIHMGLGVVDAIRAIRQKTGSEVDMRVGIHTGKVLGGVIGQKQWQYDVMSREVNVANQMESYGIPGQVHISESVLDHLNDEFELEKREKLEGSLIKDLDTYLVKSVLKQYPEGTLDQDDGGTEVESLDGKPSTEISRPSIFDESNINTKLYSEMLKKEKSSSLALGKTNNCALMFVDRQLELTYRRRENQTCGINILVLDLILCVNLLCSLTIYPIQIYSILPYLITLGLVIPMRFIHLGSLVLARCDICPRTPKFLAKVDSYRHIMTSLTTLAIYIAHVLAFYIYRQEQTTALSNLNTTVCNAMNATANSSTTPIELFTTNQCTTALYAEFYFSGIALVLVATHLLNHIGYIVQALFMMTLSLAVSCLVFFNQPSASYTSQQEQPQFYTEICASLSICGISLILTSLSYQRDKTSRKLFLSRIECDAQREKINSLREVNQALVNNILPPYIATHFLKGSNQRTLYSESYENVGVMFIAIPQFQLFYSEEHYNNDGLECIRFLNEIISDFDEILCESRFKEITKIKTIGSTYMVACGMDKKKPLSTDSNLSQLSGHKGSVSSTRGTNTDLNQNNSALSSTQRHLMKLVEFARALRDQMDSINEQAFNTFMLQIGMNYGPVIGGVIGARKPHFDIWGNTVNVASRMETTGKPGKIQFTKETMEQLQPVTTYEFEPRGQITVKGKGQLETFLLDCSPQTEDAYLWA